ncbi:PREDICTED: zinc finger CCCH domain-containing protein ZFN-like isoform X1 [Lupinus angustifolius]|uniref:zinc finger CCCH domain-containing protein ZFN-like isoform X1 n=2 Tax=Lupinus angustifolius TaxID=3871 RepID=UPI00092E6A5A|nr:PREDICTED: zinc finger CCCH domain-containing protein ZFN-like isoform X1 [Lupinus angustifolius]
MEFHPPIPIPISHLDAQWQIKSISSETMEAGVYPERPGEPDCSYYIRTGLCRFGVTCRFNHPPNRKLAIATARMKGEFPERIGQPECQYYLKTGTCKFGATCKFHHPREQAGSAGRVALNTLGYPLRPNEPECTYYLRTGQCKFGNTCKFHHPQPSNMVLSLRGSPVYPTVQSPTAPGQQSYAGGIANWSRASYIASPRWQGPSSYTPLILPQGVVSVPGWSAYSGQMRSISASDSPQQIIGNDQTYGTSRQDEVTNSGSQGEYSQFRSGSVPVGFYALQRENIFPERPGQPECQFYMKTGDCKFGAVCRFHHPRERLIPVPDCVLSPIGLPLRPGEPLCVFYSRYGICKFGPSCKFDHPMGIFTYNLSASPSAEAPGRGLLGSSSGTAALNLSSRPAESGSSKPRRLSISETRQIPSGDDDIDDEG